MPNADAMRCGAVKDDDVLQHERLPFHDLAVATAMDIRQEESRRKS